MVFVDIPRTNQGGIFGFLIKICFPARELPEREREAGLKAGQEVPFSARAQKREEEGGDCLSQGFLSRLFCFLAFFFCSQNKLQSHLEPLKKKLDAVLKQKSNEEEKITELRVRSGAQEA